MLSTRFVRNAGIADRLSSGELKTLCQKRIDKLMDASVAIDRAREMLADVDFGC